MRKRVATFIAALDSGVASHRAGIDFYQYDLHRHFDPDELHVDAVAVREKEQAEAIELALIEDYRWRFKENPPLNNSQGKWRRVAEWLQRTRPPARLPEPYDGWLNIADLVEGWTIRK